MKTKTITVNVNEDVEDKFRKLASVTYGKRKGYLGTALTDAMKEWVDRDRKNHVVRARELLDTGIKMKKWKFSRDELHER